MPDDPLAPPLIIADGGIASLLASWTEGICTPAAGGGGRSGGGVEGVGGVGGIGGPILWFPGAQVIPPALVASSLETVRRQAELCHAAELIIHADAASIIADDPPTLRAAGLRQTGMLIAAAVEAARRGLSRVIWPIHLGGPDNPAAIDLPTVADACDRALLVSQLIQIDLTGGRELRIETPYADFTDRQIAELALDLDAPLDVAAVRWCDLPPADPSVPAPGAACGRCVTCRRWAAAFAGLPRGPGVVSASPQVEAVFAPGTIRSQVTQT